MPSIFSCFGKTAEALEPTAVMLEGLLKVKFATIIKNDLTKESLEKAIQLGLDKFLPQIKAHPVLETDLLLVVDSLAEMYLFHETPDLTSIITKIGGDALEELEIKIEAIMASKFPKAANAIEVVKEVAEVATTPKP